MSTSRNGSPLASQKSWDLIRLHPLFHSEVFILHKYVQQVFPFFIVTMDFFVFLSFKMYAFLYQLWKIVVDPKVPSFITRQKRKIEILWNIAKRNKIYILFYHLFHVGVVSYINWEFSKYVARLNSQWCWYVRDIYLFKKKFWKFYHWIICFMCS